MSPLWPNPHQSGQNVPQKVQIVRHWSPKLKLQGKTLFYGPIVHFFVVVFLHGVTTLKTTTEML